MEIQTIRDLLKDKPNYRISSDQNFDYIQVLKGNVNYFLSKEYESILNDIVNFYNNN